MSSDWRGSSGVGVASGTRAAALVGLLAALVALPSCRRREADLAELLPPDRTAVTPVVFVHGFGGKGMVWLSREYDRAIAAEPDLAMRGELQVVDGAVRQVRGKTVAVRAPVRYPCYTISLSDHGCGPVEKSAAELAAVIDHVRKVERADRVSLIGFSLGGLVCRSYLTDHVDDHHVRQLVTIASPHQGSEFAVLYDFHAKLKSVFDPERVREEAEANVSTGAVNAALEQMLRALQQLPDASDSPKPEVFVGALGNFIADAGSAELRKASASLRRATAVVLLRRMHEFGEAHNIDFGSKALDQLHPPKARPDGGGNYLWQLNRRPHPTEVDYWSLVNVKDPLNASLTDLLEDLGKLEQEQEGQTVLVALLAGRIRNFIRLWEGYRAGDGSRDRGDGFVPATSQNLANVDFFRQAKIPVRVLEVNASHLDHALHQDLIPLILRSADRRDRQLALAADDALRSGAYGVAEARYGRLGTAAQTPEIKVRQAFSQLRAGDELPREAWHEIGVIADELDKEAERQRRVAKALRREAGRSH